MGPGMSSLTAPAVSVAGGVGAAVPVPTAASTPPVGVGEPPWRGRTPPPGVDVGVVGGAVGVAVGVSVGVAVGVAVGVGVGAAQSTVKSTGLLAPGQSITYWPSGPSGNVTVHSAS